MQVEHILFSTYGVKAKDEDTDYSFYLIQEYVWVVEDSAGNELHRFRTKAECKAYIMGRLEG